MLPFAGGIDGHENGTLVLSIVAACAYLWILGQPASWRRTTVKTAAVALLALLSLISGGPYALTLGLALSALGDAFLARDDDKSFLLGLASFLAAHLAYVWLFAGAAVLPPDHATLRAAGLVAIVVGAAVVSRMIWPRLPSEMKLPVCAYVGCIMAMGIAAMLVPGWMVALGALLFIFSDGVLAWHRFVMAPGSRSAASAGPVVWVAYYAGQLLIALGFLL